MVSEKLRSEVAVKKGKENSIDGSEWCERRSGPRVAVQIWVEERKGNDLYFQQTANISMGGLFFDRTVPQPLGTQVRLKFQLPGSEGIIETTGEVASIPGSPNQAGVGIRFICLDEVEKRLIRQFIEEQREEY